MNMLQTRNLPTVLATSRATGLVPAWRSWAYIRFQVPASSAREADVRRLFTLCGLLAPTLLFAASLSPPATAATVTVKVITHNIEGPSHVGDPRVLDDVAYQINTWQPHWVMLQEVCESQASDFYNAFGGTYFVRFSSRVSDVRCGGAVGELIAVRAPGISYEAKIELALDGQGRPYNLYCMNANVGGQPTTGCVTHLAPGAVDPQGGTRTTQAQQIANYVQGYINEGRGVILGGDFNARPDKAYLNSLYRIRLSDQTFERIGQFS